MVCGGGGKKGCSSVGGRGAKIFRFLVVLEATTKITFNYFLWSVKGVETTV